MLPVGLDDPGFSFFKRVGVVGGVVIRRVSECL